MTKAKPGVNRELREAFASDMRVCRLQWYAVVYNLVANGSFG